MKKHENPLNQLQNIQRESLADNPTVEKLPTWSKRFPHMDKKDPRTLFTVDRISSQTVIQGVIPVAGINTDQPLNEPKPRTSIILGINSQKNKNILNNVQTKVQTNKSDEAAKRRKHKLEQLKLQVKHGMLHQGQQIMLNYVYTGLQENQTFVDLVQMKTYVDCIKGKNRKRISKKSKRRLRRLSQIDLDSSNLSEGAKLSRLKDLKGLGLWSLWADLQESTQCARDEMEVVPIGETKNARKKARKRQRRLQEVLKDPKLSQMHRDAIERYLLDNTSLNAGKQTDFEEPARRITKSLQRHTADTQITKNARKSPRRLQEMEKHRKLSQMHRVIVEKHLLDNTWLSAGVQKDFEEPASMINQNPSNSEDIEHTRQINEVRSSIHMICTRFCESPSRPLDQIDMDNMENTPISDSRDTEHSQMPSDDKCSNTGIRPMEDTAHCLQVTIIPEGYPHIMLTEEQAGMIRSALLAKLDFLPPGITGPKLPGIDLTDGAVVVLCLDTCSQRWLEHVLETCSPGLKLTVSRPAVRASTWVPGPIEDPEVILRRLCVQNEGLSTCNWRVLDRKVMEEGQELTVLMGEGDWRRIKEVEYMPHVNFSRILFTAEQ